LFCAGTAFAKDETTETEIETENKAVAAFRRKA
jgi:hypothetical protein